MVEIFKLLLAVLVGGLIGSEREFRHGMGLRTLMLVCLGSTMFTMYSDLFAWGEGDPRRIAAAVVTGVGFLGAGVILRGQGRVLGLTTAASVWIVAALGMGIAIGLYSIVGVGTLLVFLILWGVPRLAMVTKVRTTLTYQATCLLDERKYADLTDLFRSSNLTISNQSVSKRDDRMICTWQVYGNPDKHDQVMHSFLLDPEVLEFQVV